jgi:hypothetical protein
MENAGANGFWGWRPGKLKIKALPLRPEAALHLSSKMRLRTFNDLAQLLSSCRVSGALNVAVGLWSLKINSGH